jgi:hypothetical protein
MEPWVRVTTEDEVLEQLQDNAEPIMRQVEKAFSLDGVLLKKQTINGVTFVNHGLGRAPKGYIVVRRRADVTVFDEQDGNKNPAKTLKLSTAASVVADLWVF